MARRRASGKDSRLSHMAQAVNLTFFAGVFKPRVRWGRFVGKARYWMGCNYLLTREILINRKLKGKIPTYALAVLIYHELLHSVYGLAHTREFRRAERAHPDYRISEAWVMEHAFDILS